MNSYRKINNFPKSSMPPPQHKKDHHCLVHFHNPLI